LLYNLIKDTFSPTNAKDGYEELATMDCLKTNQPKIYSEGVYLWRTNSDGLCSSLEYHLSRNGDPKVWKAWYIKNNNEINL
jgi:hypothetical protein